MYLLLDDPSVLDSFEAHASAVSLVDSNERSALLLQSIYAPPSHSLSAADCIVETAVDRAPPHSAGTVAEDVVDERDIADHCKASWKVRPNCISTWLCLPDDRKECILS